MRIHKEDKIKVKFWFVKIFLCLMAFICIKPAKAQTNPTITSISISPDKSKIDIFWNPIASQYDSLLLFYYPLGNSGTASQWRGPYRIYYLSQNKTSDEFEVPPGFNVDSTIIYFALVPYVNGTSQGGDILKESYSGHPSTILLKADTKNMACDYKINLSWNLFPTYKNSQVWINGKKDWSTTKDSSHSFTADQPDYQIYVNVNNGSKACLSNTIHITPGPSKFPSFIRNLSSDMREEGKIKLKFEVDSAPGKYKKYSLKRISDSKYKSLIDSIQITGGTFSYTDDISPNQEYFYWINVLNPCGDSVMSSIPPISKVFLTANQVENYIKLSWTDPYYDANPVYRIYRNNELIDSLENATLDNEGRISYKNPLSSLDPNFKGSTLSYYIEALQRVNSYGNVHAYSNICIIPLEDNIEMPEFFTPNGDNKNDNYIPVVRTPEKCLFIIYDRAGNKVFETQDPVIMTTKGWDGKVNGKTAPEGIYIYYIKTETQNITKVKRGTFVLVIP